MGGPNRVREAWSAGRPSLGAFCGTTSSVMAETLAKAGFEFVVVDTQHGGPTLDSLAALIQGIELGGATPLVRVPWNDPPTIMRVLDLGAAGVIVPMVSTADDARAAAAACRYPPAGVRSYGVVRGGWDTLATANREVLCLVMIETAQGLDNTEEIVATDGVDGIFIGPVDLSLSLGVHGTGGSTTSVVADTLAGALRSPTITGAISTITDACRRHGRLAATVCPGPADVPGLVEQGLGMLSVATDTRYVKTGADRDVADLAAYLRRD